MTVTPSEMMIAMVMMSEGGHGVVALMEVGTVAVIEVHYSVRGSH